MYMCDLYSLKLLSTLQNTLKPLTATPVNRVLPFWQLQRLHLHLLPDLSYKHKHPRQSYLISSTITMIVS